jgi:hypothetical protein
MTTTITPLPKPPHHCVMGTWLVAGIAVMPLEADVQACAASAHHPDVRPQRGIPRQLRHGPLNVRCHRGRVGCLPKLQQTAPGKREADRWAARAHP